MRLPIRRILQISTGLLALWFFYWLFINEMVVWRKPYPTCLDNVLYLITSLLLFGVFSSSRLFGRIHRIIKRKPAEDRITAKRLAPSKSFISYMFSYPVYWYWATVSLMVITALIVFFSTPESIDLIIYSRYILGSIYILWFPGYSIVRAILPKGELKNTERIVLSLGMSLASVSMVGLLLNFTPSGLNTISVTLSMFGITITGATAALIREYFS